MGRKNLKPQAELLKSDMKYIRCGVCRKMVEIAYDKSSELLEKRFAFKKKRKNEATEFDGEGAVQEFVEKMCNPVKNEGEWVSSERSGNGTMVFGPGDEYEGHPPDAGGDGEPPAAPARAADSDAAEAREAHAALVARLKDYVARGLDPTEEIRRNRDFHNPMLLEKIVRYFDIDDIASQFPKHIFDPEAISNRRSKDKKKSSQSSPRAADAAPPA